MTNTGPAIVVDKLCKHYGAFKAVDNISFTVKAGETIEFAMTNTATDTQHEFEVLGPDGKALGEIGPTDPGQTATVVLSFDKAGSYTFVCGISDHEAMGMKGSFTVTSA